MKALWSALVVVLALCAVPAASPLFAEESWVPLGPPGGDIMELLVHPHNPRVLWAGTLFGGIYKSVDGGASWSRSNQGLPFPEQFRALALAPSAPQTLYLAAGNGPVQVYRSSDGGQTWNVVLACNQNPAPGGCAPIDRILGLFVHPRVPRTVFAATQQGLLKSVDGGRQWRRQGLPAASTLAFDPRNPQIVYAGNAQGIFKSRNGGATWEPANAGLGGADIHDIAIDPRNPRRMWAGGPDGVYRSTDGGARWRRGGSGPVLVESLALSPGGGQGDLPAVWAGTAQGLFRSLDGGSTWTRSQELRNHLVAALAVHPRQPGTVWAGTQMRLPFRVAAGVYKSVNGGAAWTFSSRGLFEAFSLDLAFDPVNPGVLWVAAPSGIWRSTNGGATWTERSRGIPVRLGPRAVEVDPRDPQTLWAGTTQGVFVTEDAGATWEARREGLIRPGARLPASVLEIALAPSDPSIAYARTGLFGLFRTADAGEHWTKLPTPTHGVSGLSDVLVDARDPDRVFVAWNGLWVSRDGGGSWEKLAVGSESARFVEVEADPRDPDVIYAGANEGIFRSTDGGQTWQRVAEIAVFLERSLAVGPTGEVWAVTFGGLIYRSPNGVSGWAPIPLPANILNLYELEIDPHAPHDAFLTTGNGIFRFTEED